MEKLMIYKGNEIHYEKRNGTYNVNMTEIAKSFPKKNLSDIINSKEIKEYINVLNELKSEIGIPLSDDLLIVRKGGDLSENNQGTWANELLAIRICQKLSPVFAVMVDMKIRDLMKNEISDKNLLEGVPFVNQNNKSFFNYLLAMEKFKLPTNQQQLAGRIGKNRADFICIDMVWFVSERYCKYLISKRETKFLRTEITNQSKFIIQYNKQLELNFKQIGG